MRQPLILATLVLAACGGGSGEPVDPGDPNEPDVSAVDIAPADTSLYVGGSFQARPTVTITSGEIFPGDHVEYESLDPGVSVSSAGVVTGQAIGRARVVAMRGELRDTAWISVVPQGTIAFNGAGLTVARLDGSVSWVAPGYGGQPTWLADGRIVQEREDPPLPPLLYVASPDGSVTTFFPLPPIDEAKSERWPRASRDGQWVYYTSAEGLRRVHADGTGLESITETPFEIKEEYPDPSPDGSRLVFVRTDNSVAPSVVTMIVRDLTTGAEQPIDVGEAAGFGPRWSPDGQWIAYWKAFDGADRESLYIIRADGSGQRRVTPVGERYYEASIDWSPDSAWLVASRGILVVVEVATGMELPLAWARQSIQGASWKP